MIQQQGSPTLPKMNWGNKQAYFRNAFVNIREALTLNQWNDANTTIDWFKSTQEKYLRLRF